MRYQAQQGDIITLNFNPQKGHEQHGRRPALVVSNNFFNHLSSLALVCPISNTLSSFPLNIILNEQTTTTGSILCQHVKSLDLEARDAVYVEQLSPALLQEVLDIIHGEF